MLAGIAFQLAGHPEHAGEPHSQMESCSPEIQEASVEINRALAEVTHNKASKVWQFAASDGVGAKAIWSDRGAADQVCIPRLIVDSNAQGQHWYVRVEVQQLASLQPCPTFCDLAFSAEDSLEVVPAIKFMAAA